MWYDHTSGVLSKLCFQFTIDEWEALAQEIHQLPPQAQEKCLYTIDEANPIYAFKIALILLGSEKNNILIKH